MKKIKNKVMLLFALICFMVFANIPVEASSLGNEWILDESQVISEETENYIKNLNENVFQNYKNKPQLGVMVIDNLPYGYTIDEYKLEQFNLYGVGTKEENCGLLFVLAINDRKYGLEIGDGYEKGTFLRNDLEKDFITEELKNKLRAEKYDEVIFEVVQHLEQIMADEENGVYLKEQEQWQAEVEASNAAFDAFVSKACRWFVGIGATGGVSLLLAHLISYILKRKFIKEQFVKYKNHILVLNINTKDFTKYLMKDKSPTSISDSFALITKMKKSFLNDFYEYYINKEFGNIINISHLKTLYNSLDEYKYYLKKINNKDVFINLKLKSTKEIIQIADADIARIEREKAEAKRKMEEIESKNYIKINLYLKNNKNKIINNNISLEELEERLKKYCKIGELLSDTTLEKAFNEELKEMNFKYEYDKFISENKDKIDSKYFNSTDFYNSLKKSDNYKYYRYIPGYNNSWMLPLLFLQMENRREEQKRREARQRQEEARRERERRNSYNNYGNSFGGGFSSGGGFSGGW